MSEEMRESTPKPELEALSDLPANDVDASEQSEVKGGRSTVAKSNIAGSYNKTADALVANIRG